MGGGRTIRRFRVPTSNSSNHFSPLMQVQHRRWRRRQRQKQVISSADPTVASSRKFSLRRNTLCVIAVQNQERGGAVRGQIHLHFPSCHPQSQQPEAEHVKGLRVPNLLLVFFLPSSDFQFGRWFGDELLIGMIDDDGVWPRCPNWNRDFESRCPTECSVTT